MQLKSILKYKLRQTEVPPKLNQTMVCTWNYQIQIHIMHAVTERAGAELQISKSGFFVDVFNPAAQKIDIIGAVSRTTPTIGVQCVKRSDN